jgi:hypothetical protein
MGQTSLDTVMLIFVIAFGLIILGSFFHDPVQYNNEKPRFVVMHKEEGINHKVTIFIDKATNCKYISWYGGASVTPLLDHNGEPDCWRTKK